MFKEATMFSILVSNRLSFYSILRPENELEYGKGYYEARIDGMK